MRVFFMQNTCFFTLLTVSPLLCSLLSEADALLVIFFSMHYFCLVGDMTRLGSELLLRRMTKQNTHSALRFLSFFRNRIPF